MFTSNLDPVFFSIGSFEIRYYSLVYLLAFILAFFVVNHFRKKGMLEITKDQTYDLIFYILVGVIVGARFFHVFIFNPDYYVTNPSEILAIWHGGVSYHGGLLGALLAAWLFSKKHKVSLAKIADIVVLPTVLMLAFGRIANFMNAELLGKVTTSSWCVNFSGHEGCRHPTQLYAAAYRFLIFGYLLFIKNKKPGFLFWNYILLEGVGRFIVDFYREDTTLAALTGGQWLSIAMIGIAIYVLIKKYKKA